MAMFRRFVPITLMLFLIGGVAYAAIPDASGVIHGCYKLNNPAKGSVLVIDSEVSETCPSGFASLNWNQTGPQGPTGATGPQGSQGEPLAFYSVYVDKTFAPTSTNAFGVACDNGDVPVGGEYNGVSPDSGLHITTSQFGGNVWAFQVDNSDFNSRSARFGVRCADYLPHRP